MNKTIVSTGILFIISGIILGAFGAHKLKDIVDATKLNSFEVGVRYQLFQGIGLLVLGLTNQITFSLKPFFILSIFGTILFSSSLYLLSFSDVINLPISLIGPITPIGGVLMIFSWCLLFIQIQKIRKNT